MLRAQFVAIALLAWISTVGCTHHQLRFNASHQARSVGDLHTQQVLDNLAKFAHNPASLPHFSYPQASATGVTDSLASSSGVGFNPHGLRDWSIGLTGGRVSDEAYTLIPINDPRKLELMRCAYQIVVQGHCSSACTTGCPNCELLMNRFYLGAEHPAKTLARTSHGDRIVRLYDDTQRSSYRDLAVTTNEHNETVYIDVQTGQFVEDKVISDALRENRLLPLYVEDSPATLNERTGKTTVACLDSCWFKVGTRKDFKKAGTCCLVGEYCGTYVWVPESNRDQLSKLTLVILDIAFNDAARLVPSATKEVVTLYSADGSVAKSRNEAAFEVRELLDRSERFPPKQSTSTPTAGLSQARDKLNSYRASDDRMPKEQFRELLNSLDSNVSKPGAGSSQTGAPQSSGLNQMRDTIERYKENENGISKAEYDRMLKSLDQEFERLDAPVQASPERFELPADREIVNPRTEVSGGLLLNLERLQLDTLTPRR